MLGRCHAGYSRHRRGTYYRGEFHWYAPPDHLEPDMQQMIDRYHHDWKRTNPWKSLATLLVTFMHLHPFPDGNGRTAKLIVYYVFKSLEPQPRLSFLDYSCWCQHLHRRDVHPLYLWLRQQV